MQRLRAVRWRVIRFFRDCEDVPIILGCLSCVAAFSVLWLLVTWWFGTTSWNWVQGLDALIPPKQFLVLGFEDEISQLAAT